ncbi:hypothetical protein ACIRST_38905 [Kitasatospora sp. NPDC101447]|uniref:hypothetical protein n=1 Tax=Kitasatospora sp. NPDC101447 TaxID=3364102 RepID=UPI003812D89D
MIRQQLVERGETRLPRSLAADALVHYDDLNREFHTGLFDQEVIAQLAFNVWAPSRGATAGQRAVPALVWLPARSCRALPARRPGPQICNGLLFNPANFHPVAPTPSRRRIAFAFFLSLT